MRHAFCIYGLLLLAKSGLLIGQPITLMGVGNNYYPPTQVAPGEIVNLLVSNTKTVFPPTSIPGTVATSLPLPTNIAGFSVSIRDIAGTHPVPLLSVGQGPLCEFNRTSPDCLATGLQIQIPFEMAWSEETLVELIVNDNGTQSEPFLLSPREDKIHVLTTCEVNGGSLSNGLSMAFPPCTGVVQHADGSLVSSYAPAQPGEVVVIYALGMGTTLPAVVTGQATPTPAPVLGIPTGPRTVTLQFDFRPNAMPSHPYVSPSATAPTPVFVGLVPGQVGLYQVNVKLPDSLPAVTPCTGPTAPLLTSASYVQTNLTIDIGGIDSFDGAAICVQAGQ